MWYLVVVMRVCCGVMGCKLMMVALLMILDGATIKKNIEDKNGFNNKLGRGIKLWSLVI
jgi:hypothetical protein